MVSRRLARMNLAEISALSELADYSFAFAIRAVAVIGVADHLQDRPLHIDQLASRTECNRGGLLRVMRALATKSVFSEDPPETFALRPKGDLLRTDHPLSMRWFFRLQPDIEAIARMEHSIRTGKPAFDEHFGMGYFDWLAGHDELRSRFRESQRALNRLEMLGISRSYPWSEVGSLVDVGGNDGSLVATLLQQNSTMVGTVFDLPEAVTNASAVLEDAGVADRARTVAGNVLTDRVPAGADLYTIKRVLVGFSDDEAVAACSAIRDAMTPSSRLLIMEPVRDTADGFSASLDLLMLVLGLGRVRTIEVFGELLSQAGLELENTRRARPTTIIEAKRDDV